MGKRYNLGKKKWCDLWINCTKESQSDYKNNQWFKNGYNKSLYFAADDNFVDVYPITVYW